MLASKAFMQLLAGMLVIAVAINSKLNVYRTDRAPAFVKVALHSAAMAMHWYFTGVKWHVVHARIYLLIHAFLAAF
jgi:hypothetical protein